MSGSPTGSVLDSLATDRMLPLLLGFRLMGGCAASDWVLFFGMVWFCWLRSASLFSEDTDIVPVELSILLLRLRPEP